MSNEKPVVVSNLLQITPATGWVALFGEGDNESVRPVVCWGLSKLGQVIAVVSVDGQLVDAKGLDGYKDLARDDEMIMLPDDFDACDIDGDS